MIITESEFERRIPEAGVNEIVAQWRKELRLPEKLLGQFEEGSGLFSKTKIAEQDPATDIEFWVSNGVFSDDQAELRGAVRGQIGPYSTRELLSVSSEKAEEAAQKVREGKSFDELPKAEKVSMLALTKAKILAVEPVALDVYP